MQPACTGHQCGRTAHSRQIVRLCACLAAPQVNVNKVWLTVSSVLLGLSFIFGNSIRNVFESVVFLFVVHPFDVGDALLITDPANSGDGPQYSKVSGSSIKSFFLDCSTVVPCQYMSSSAAPTVGHPGSGPQHCKATQVFHPALRRWRRSCC